MLYDLIIVILLVLLSGIFAGLTLALFGIKLSTLERKIRMGDQQAEKVYAIRKNGNRLLCTLLLGNVASYTIMAIFLASITSGVIAGFIATALIFVFGEILPQAVFPRYALQIGAKLSWLVSILLVLFYPVAAPIAWLLDKLLGEEPPVLWTKRELEEIIRYHENVGDGIIDKDEKRIIIGALSFSELRVKNVMIPLKQVFYLKVQATLSKSLLEKIKTKGYSRLPIVDAHQKIVGVLATKNLIGLTANRSCSLEEICNKEDIIVVDKQLHLDDLLNLLVKKKNHMALVEDIDAKLIGIVTMEDIMEEILKTELEDQKQ